MKFLKDITRNLKEEGDQVNILLTNQMNNSKSRQKIQI